MGARNTGLAAKKKFTIKQPLIFNPLAYRNFATGLFAFLVAFVAASTLAPTANSSAEEAVLDKNVTVTNNVTGYYVTVSSSSSVDINVDSAPAGVIATGTDRVNVKTNAPNGYKLYISAESSSLYNNEDTAHSNAHFSPVNGSLSSKAALGQNTWGFTLDDASTTELADMSIWAKVPDDDTVLISETSAAEYATGVNTDIYYGVKANSALASGDYGTTVYYTATAEGVTETFMQDFTNAECAAMSTDSTTRLMDSRNAEIYTVVKAKDGNCWMADNLSISDVTIYPTDSNINSGSFYIPKSSEWDTNDYSQALMHIVTEDSTSTLSGDAKKPYLGQHYYNWYAATAGATPITDTSNVTTSICPKGWRLPINGDETVDKSYAKLLNAYSITTGAQLLSASALGFTQYYGSWNWNNNSEYYQGTNGFFWSSTPGGADGARRLDYNSLAVYPHQDSRSKGIGYSIRCVFGDSRTINDITYMQEMNTNICQNTAETTSYADAKTLLDRRGNYSAGSSNGGYKVVKAKDGNCWMADNFNLYNKQISATDSDFTSGTYTLPNTSDWTINNYTEALVHRGTTLEDQVYYNWCSAVALMSTCNTTVQQDQSVCPKNWTLPTGSRRSIATLARSYGITKGSSLLTNETLGIQHYYGDWWWGGGEDNIAKEGYFWHSTPSIANTEMALLTTYNPDSLINGNPNYKSIGISVRCVAR